MPLQEHAELPSRENSAMTTPSQPHLQLLHILILLAAAGADLLIQAATIPEQHEPLPITLPGCPDKCGDISIPFPFGMKPGCFLEGFEVTCDNSFQPPRVFLSKGGRRSATTLTFTSNFSMSNTGNYLFEFPTSNPNPDQHISVLPVELVDISVAESEARLYGAVVSACNKNSTAGSLTPMFTSLLAKGTEGPFLVSLARNVLIGVGPEIVATSYTFNTSHGAGDVDFLVSCSSSILGNLQLTSNGSCSGHGCCQASLPEELPLTGFALGANTVNNTMWMTNPCSFAMLVERSWYNFSTADLYLDSKTIDKFPRGVPYVIDFAIRNARCPAEGQKPPSDYACVSGNSTCADVTKGYVCKCSEHYEGNPYIPNGCQDIDECKRPDLYPCSTDGICKNRLLGYDCPCKPGMKGDGKTGKCQPVFSLVAKIVVGVIGSFFFMAALLFIFLLRKEKKKMRDFYEKNGGPTLDKAKIIKLYKKEELKKILKSKNRIGNGFHGEVYKGNLDNKMVIVKKPISGGARENNEQFVNEVIIQSQVIHKNIVRLIGCCLEVDIPMLVYEFLPKGNLEDILHSKNAVPLNLDVRLSIAAQSADGLAYMHSKTSNKILHGDVTPGNILLDDNFFPKISGFGISRLIARDKEQAEKVNGDKSYMDPVYMQTGLLTEKSDVYSFGVVILELISRKKATYSDNNSLVRNFLEAHKEERVADLFDNEIALTRNLEHLHIMARLAVECLNLNTDQRPSMIEVAERLLLLNRSRNP